MTDNENLERYNIMEDEPIWNRIDNRLPHNCANYNNRISDIHENGMCSCSGRTKIFSLLAYRENRCPEYAVWEPMVTHQPFLPIPDDMTHIKWNCKFFTFGKECECKLTNILMERRVVINPNACIEGTCIYFQSTDEALFESMHHCPAMVIMKKLGIPVPGYIQIKYNLPDRLYAFSVIDFTTNNLIITKNEDGVLIRLKINQKNMSGYIFRHY